MTAFSGTGVSDEIYCIINSADNIEGLADEINIRVSAATRFLIDSKPFSKLSKAFSRKYTVQQILQEIKEKKQLP
jgi:hypothetical protein